MTHKHKKRCTMCGGKTTYSQVNTASGNREMYLCEQKNATCVYAEPITGKYEWTYTKKLIV